MRTTFITFGILQVFLTLKLNYNNAVEIKFTNVVCESYNKSWMVINTCRLRALSRNRTIFNLNCTILHPANDILVKMQVYKRANGYKPWVIKTVIDACRFVKKSYDPVAILAYKQFKEYTNMNHTCPYVGPQIVKGFYLRHDVLKLPFPTGEYLVAIDWLFDKKPQLATNYYFRYVEDL